MLLEALRGSTSALASGGAFARVGEASLLLAILAPLPTLMFADPFFWWAGRDCGGPKAAAVLGGGHPSAERWAQRSGAHLERFGGFAVVLAPYLPVPSAFHLRGRRLDRDEPAAFPGVRSARGRCPGSA